MASETLGADELPKKRHRWDENSKVYTRKVYRTKKIDLGSSTTTTTTASAAVDNAGETTTTTTTTNATATANNSNNDGSSNTLKDKDNDVTNNRVVNGVAVSNKEDSNNNENYDRENEDVGEKLPSSPPRPPAVEEANPPEDSLRLGAASGDSPQPRQVSFRVRDASGDALQAQQDSLRIGEDTVTVGDVSGDSLQPQPRKGSLRLRAPLRDSLQPQENGPRLVVTVSGDSSSLNRAEPPVPNGHDENMENGSTSRTMVTQVDDRLNISVSAARSKEEVRDLKRKLVDELDQVRKMAKKLEAKEMQVSGYSSIGVETSVPVDDHLQFPVNGGVEKDLSSGGGMRMNSETHSAGYNDPRPYRRLSVSVVNNNHHGAISEVVEKEKRTPKANQYYRNSEFLLGKDRLPPESNKKAKSAGGKKHGGGEFDFGFRIDKKIFSKCSSLLQKIMNHKHGWVFNQPVDVKRLGLHDYFDIIKHPMDLGTVKARLTKNWYKTPREFAEDVRLTFHNALTYNPPGQDVHIMAQELLRMFEEKWPAIEVEFDRKLRYEMIRDLGVPTPTSRKTYAPARVSIPMSLAPPPLLHPPPSFQEMRNLERSQSMPIRPESRPKPAYSVGRKPVPKKPKAKDPHKRDMTFEEKQKLSTHLQSLPSEKLDAIVQIIKKRNSALSQHDDEIEVDIDSVDAETLWELDRFVTNYKKSLSKHKRKAELAQARAAEAAAAQAAQETTPALANTEAPRETAAPDEGNAPTPPRPQHGEKRIDNRINNDNNNNSLSSSSSSSSSDSGSSSSDSDSDSSSGSDSEGGH